MHGGAALGGLRRGFARRPFQIVPINDEMGTIGWRRQDALGNHHRSGRFQLRFCCKQSLLSSGAVSRIRVCLPEARKAM